MAMGLFVEIAASVGVLGVLSQRFKVAVGDSAWVLSRTTEIAGVDKPAFIDNSSAPTTPLANGACGILSANRGVSCLRGRDRHGGGGLQRPHRQPRRQPPPPPPPPLRTFS